MDPILKAELERFAPLEREALAAKPSLEHIEAAVTQLRRNGRGQQVLQGIAAMLDNGACSLLAAARVGNSIAVLETVSVE